MIICNFQLLHASRGNNPYELAHEFEQPRSGLAHTMHYDSKDSYVDDDANPELKWKPRFRHEIKVPWEFVDDAPMGKWRIWTVPDNNILNIVIPYNIDWWGYFNETVAASGSLSSLEEKLTSTIYGHEIWDLTNYYGYANWAHHYKDIVFKELNNRSVGGVQLYRYTYRNGVWKEVDNFYLAFRSDTHTAWQIHKANGGIRENDNIHDSGFRSSNSDTDEWWRFNSLKYDLNHYSWKDIDGIGIRVAKAKNSKSDITDNIHDDDYVSEERRFDFRFDPSLDVTIKNSINDVEDSSPDLIQINDYNDNRKILSFGINCVQPDTYRAFQPSWNGRGSVRLSSITATVKDVILDFDSLNKKNMAYMALNINYFEENGEYAFYPLDNMEEWYYNKYDEEKDYYYDRRRVWWIDSNVERTDWAFLHLFDYAKFDKEYEEFPQFNNFDMLFSTRDPRRFSEAILPDQSGSTNLARLYDSTLIHTLKDITLIKGEGFLNEEIQNGTNDRTTYVRKITENLDTNITNQNDLFLYLENIPYFWVSSYDVDNTPHIPITIEQLGKYPLEQTFNSINYSIKQLNYNISHHMSIMSYQDIQSFYLIMQNRLINYYNHLTEHDLETLYKTNENITLCNDLIKKISGKQKNIKATSIKVEALNLSLNKIKATLFNTAKNKDIDLSEKISLFNNKLRLDFNVSDYIDSDEELFVKWFLKVEPIKELFTLPIIEANVNTNFILLLNNDIINDLKNSTLITEDYTYKIINKIDNKLILSENIISELNTDKIEIIKNYFEPVIMELEIDWQSLYIPDSIEADLYTEPAVEQPEEEDIAISEPADIYTTEPGADITKDEFIW
jgi:hypothetical protein